MKMQNNNKCEQNNINNNNNNNSINKINQIVVKLKWKQIVLHNKTPIFRK